MISRSTIKFYVIPFLIFIIIVVFVMVTSSIKPKSPSENPTQILPSPTSYVSSPTPYSLLPTLIPLQPFTGAAANQELPLDIKNIGLQKTALRRLTPLTLPFGIIDFDYTNDKFILSLKAPKDQSQITFSAWLKQTYPALTEDKFVFN